MYLRLPHSVVRLSSLFFSFCSGQKYFVSMYLMAPLPLRRASPRAPAARELRVLAHGSCWPSQWLRLHSEPCCSIMVRRCSAPPLFVSTSTSPTCVVRCASCLRMLGVASWGTQRLLRRSVRPSRCSLLVVGTHGTWRVEQVLADSLQAREVCLCSFPESAAFFASERDIGACLTRGMPVLLTRRDTASAHPAPVLRG